MTLTYNVQSCISISMHAEGHSLLTKCTPAESWILQSKLYLNSRFRIPGSGFHVFSRWNRDSRKSERHARSILHNFSGFQPGIRTILQRMRVNLLVHKILYFYLVVRVPFTRKYVCREILFCILTTSCNQTASNYHFSCLLLHDSCTKFFSQFYPIIALH